MPPRICPALFAALAALAVRVSLRAEMSRGDFYATNQDRSNTAPRPDAAYPEFTGILQSRDATEVSLRDNASGRSHWVRLRDPDAAYYVEHFDAGTQTVTVRIAGTSRRISLRRESRPAECAPTTPAPGEQPVITGKFAAMTPEGQPLRYWHTRAPYTVEGPGGRDPEDPGLDD